MEEIRAVEVHETSYVAVAFPAAGFIDTDPGHATPIALGMGLIDIVAEHSPQPGVVNAKRVGRLADRHLGNQQQRPRFEQQGEAAAGPGPRHFDLMHAALRALGPGNFRYQLGLVLPKVQVPPAPLASIMDPARAAALGAGCRSNSLFEIHFKGQLFRLALEGA